MSKLDAFKQMLNARPTPQLVGTPDPRCACVDGIDAFKAMVADTWTDPGPCPLHEPDAHAEAQRQAEVDAARDELARTRAAHAAASLPLNAPPDAYPALTGFTTRNDPDGFTAA